MVSPREAIVVSNVLVRINSRISLGKPGTEVLVDAESPEVARLLGTKHLTVLWREPKPEPKPAPKPKPKAKTSKGSRTDEAARSRAKTKKKASSSRKKAPKREKGTSQDG